MSKRWKELLHSWAVCCWEKIAHQLFLHPPKTEIGCKFSVSDLHGSVLCCVSMQEKIKLFPDVFWGQIVEWCSWKAYSCNLLTYKTNERGRCPTKITWIFQLLLHMAACSQSSWSFIDTKMIRSANNFSSTSVVALFP